MKPEKHETKQDFILRFSAEKGSQYPDFKARVEAAELAWSLTKKLEEKTNSKIIQK